MAIGPMEILVLFILLVLGGGAAIVIGLVVVARRRAGQIAQPMPHEAVGQGQEPVGHVGEGPQAHPAPPYEQPHGRPTDSTYRD